MVGGRRSLTASCWALAIGNPFLPCRRRFIEKRIEIWVQKNWHLDANYPLLIGQCSNLQLRPFLAQIRHALSDGPAKVFIRGGSDAAFAQLFHVKPTVT